MNIQHLNISGRPSTRIRRSQRRLSPGARGFTLIELMVVLGIMAIVTSITLGAFKSLTDNNQRTACQANLVQVYQGLRLYMADSDGQAPYYNPRGAKGTKNIGLWNLWTYPDPNDVDQIAPIKPAATGAFVAPTARYLRSTNVLHCPADSEPGVDPTLRPNPADLYKTANKDAYNPDYLSYQMYATSERDSPYTAQDKPYSSQDEKGKDTIDASGVGTLANLFTYLPERTATTTDPQFKRQLRQPITPAPTAPLLDYYKRLPVGSTIVTWCRHHRYTRDYDNVLFFDGSVQLIPRAQDEFAANSCNTTGTILQGSDRVPRRTDCE